MSARWLSPAAGLAALYLFLAAATAVKIAQHEFASSHLIDQIAARQDLNAVTTMDAELKSNGMGYFTRLILRVMDPKKSSVAEAAKNQQAILTLVRELKQEAAASAYACLVLIGFTLLFLAAAGRAARLHALLCVSLIFFLLGIFLPVLTAVVKGQHMLVGGFIIETSSKGIVSTITTLLRAGDWIIALLLFGFSVGIPIFKGIATVIASLSRSDARRHRVAALLERIARWSLTDVLVAAVLLGCFSLNAIRQPDGGVVAVPRFAFGFFILYCVLAARTSFLLKTAPRPAAAPPAAAIRRTAAVLLGALAGGAAFGAVVFDRLGLAREAGNLAVVKLVRTHAELLSDKFDAAPGHPQSVPFEVPYAGDLTIRVQGAPSAALDISVVRDPSTPLPAWHGNGSDYRHQDRVEAGKYDVIVRHDEADEGLRGGDRFRLHITIDP